MPQIMTPEEAESKICPFIATPAQEMYCMGNGCACWGWVDPERGQESPLGKDHERTELPQGEEPAGDGWHKGNFQASTKIQNWWRRKVIGARRGQCEAMSPNIEVINES